MTVANAKQMLIRAAQGRYAVGAFNVTSLVQMAAAVDAAVGRRAPVIIQTSLPTVTFYTPKVLAAAYRALAEDAPVPVCLHLDHCEDPATCMACAEAGYTSIMIDASKQDLETNIGRTRQVVDHCGRLGDITVEGELGTVMGVEDQVAVAEDEARLCNPEHALEFVERSGVDLFAPAIGTAHGLYKTDTPRLDFDRLETISALLNGRGVRAPLVVHGGTGLHPDVVRRLVALGGAKFNVSTELKMTLIDATADYLETHRREYNPGRIDAAVRGATRARIEGWIDLLGSAGKA
ncbi:MAG TPA: class II fructose-bisphosphate aldolase [Desulfobacterales bacterium]|nr:class II fructose-bisphosphate aldolase [Desulfobacterales bacterium]